MKLVKKGQQATAPKQEPSKKMSCTNWAAEFRAAETGRPAPQQQWRELFREDKD